MAPKLEDLLKYDLSKTEDSYDDVCKIIEKVDIDAEKEEKNLKKAFQVAQKVVAKLYEENVTSLDLFEKEIDKASNRENELKEELEIALKQLKIYQQDPGATDAREMTRLETKNEQLRNELKELEAKSFQEKTDKDRLQLKVEDLEKKISKLARDNERYEEEIREYGKKFQSLRDEKYSRTGEESEMYRERISQKNKLIDELEKENFRLTEENQELDRLLSKIKQDLQDSAVEMEKSREEIRKLKLLLRHNDDHNEEYKKENDILKSQIELLKEQIINHHNQDNAIMSTVDERVKEFKLVIAAKEDEIKKLRDLVIQMKDSITKAQVDSDKASVSVLTKALQEKDKQIDILKKQIDEYAKEMDKSAALINNLNQTFYENSKMYTKSSQYNASKQAEQRILYLENQLKESDARLKDSEKHAMLKEKELNDVLTRMREYESGDYQLQQAVNEIKGLKTQIKIRDRDIETLTKHLNKLDYQLEDVLQENDDLRAKLGMEPKEKLNLDELNNLRAIRAQENRAYVYVLQKEIEKLSEEKNELHLKVRKLAKQIGSKETVASILEDDLDYYNDMLESKSKKKIKDDELNDKNNKNNQVDAVKVNKDNELLKKRNEQLMQILLEFENENKLLEKGLIEIRDQLTDINNRNISKDPKKSKLSTLNKTSKESVIKCPSLDKLLNEIESNRTIRSNLKTYSFLNQILTDNGADGISLALKSEIDYLQGRNEELRGQILQLKSDLNKSQVSLIKAQDEVEMLNKDVRLMNSNSSAKDIFQPFKLPPGMTPSSQDIISALNEYLIDTLQELEEYKRVSSMSEKELDSLKRKYSVARHQISLLYKEHIDETKNWKNEKENLIATIKKLNDTISVDSVKLQEYDRLLDTLEKDESEVRRRIADSSRQMHLLRTSEKKLQLKCDALEETDLQIIKENKKMRIEIIEMEIAVQQRIGYLERYKDMANFRIMSLQKQLEESVPVSKLEIVNKEYNEVVQNYRQLLDKQDKNDLLTQTLNQTEQLNKKYENEIEFLRTELENEKDKAHVLEESLNRMKIFPLSGHDHHMTSSTNIEHESSMLSMAKRLTAIEMKELNERQKADHAQRMYDQQRNILRELENRNIELEANFSQLSKKYLTLEKTETNLREQLTQFVPKSVNDQDKQLIKDLQQQEHLLKLEVSRLRELTEITLYQTASLEFINNMNKLQLGSLNLIDIETLTNEVNDVGKLHRQLIIMQISESTAVRKLQQAQTRCKKLEAQLIRTEQKYDRDNLDFFNYRKDYISKITYLRSTIQDLRHKYTGSIPLKQQEKFNAAKEKIAELKKDLNEKLLKINEEKFDLEDRIAEYTARLKEIETLKNAAVIGNDGSVKFNQKFLDSFKKSENLKMLNLKLERANRRYKDEIKFLEEINRKHEITIICLEEENLRLESDYDQKLLIWEHREADLERTIDHLRKQHQTIENLAINFEEITGNMPDQSLPVANQLDQALNIIRSHIKLLAEAKIQSDISKKRIEELESKIRQYDSEINLRDKAIAELRLRLPATMDRDVLVKSTLNGTSSDQNLTPVKAAQATIESLQSRLKQKDETIAKYQDMLKLARDEILNINKQHELEINNMLDKLNLTRDTNLQKLKQDLINPANNMPNATRSQLSRLQELEEVTVEQDNTISALNIKIRKLNTEIDTWKAKYELLNEKSAQELEKTNKEQVLMIEKMNEQMEEYREKIASQEKEMNSIIAELENQKQLTNKSPSIAVKTMVEKLKQQLAQKEQQQSFLNQALLDLKSDMLSLAKTNLISAANDENYDKKIQNIIEKTSGEYQDKLFSLTEELNKIKKELKAKIAANQEITLELENLKAQSKIKDQKIKKLTDENRKLIEDGKIFSSNKMVQNFSLENKASNDVEVLKRQIRNLEEKLKKQKLVAEKPYETEYKPSGKNSKEQIVKVVTVKSNENNDNNVYSLKSEMEQWKTRYNYVLSENSILNRQKNDLEIENARLKREIDLNAVEVANENKLLRQELERIKTIKSRNYSPAKFNDIRLENKTQITSELEKLVNENDKLKERLKRMEDLERQIEFYRAENERLRNDDTLSNSSNSSIRRIGESGKSNKELEKTIAMMKKIILKLQSENESLKNNFK